MLLKSFETLVSPEQKKLQAVVDRKGGVEACRSSDHALQSLLNSDPDSVESHTFKSAVKYGLEELRSDLSTDIDAALKENMVTFTSKLEMQQQQIQDHIDGAVHRGTDRVLAAITSGPHERILDPVSCHRLVPLINSS